MTRVPTGRPPGRPKGSQEKIPRGLDKRLRVKAKQKALEGIAPLDFLLDTMRDVSRPYEMRLDAAKAAAPYIHPKLQAIHVTNDGQKKHDDWVREIEAALKSHDRLTIEGKAVEIDGSGEDGEGA